MAAAGGGAWSPGPGGGGALQCAVCRGMNAGAVRCGHCEKAVCPSCTDCCAGCDGSFCRLCTTVSYLGRYEETYCPPCHEHAAQAAREQVEGGMEL